MFYPTPESGARKIWRHIVWQTLQKPTPVFWRRFLAPVSGPCVRGISSTGLMAITRSQTSSFKTVDKNHQNHRDKNHRVPSYRYGYREGTCQFLTFKTFFGIQCIISRLGGAENLRKNAPLETQTPITSEILERIPSNLKTDQALKCPETLERIVHKIAPVEVKWSE